MQNEVKYMSVSDYAKNYPTKKGKGCTRQFVYNLIATGKLKAVKMYGKILIEID